MKTRVCKNPQFARLLPVAVTSLGKARLEQNKTLLGRFFCFDCGGETLQTPGNYDHVTGDTVIERLIELGAAKPYVYSGNKQNI